MIGKKENGKLKINWDAIGVLIIIAGIVVTGIVKSSNLQGQQDGNTGTINEVVINTTKKVEGTLKFDVERNKDENARQDGNISILETKLNSISEAQKELKSEMQRSNKELKDMMNIIIQKLN